MARSNVWPLLLALILCAVLVRFPEMAVVPAPTDETDELLVALSIYRDGARPLSTSEPYLGPLHVYLISLAYTLLGPSFEAGRALSVVMGALVVPAAWLLARTLAGRVAGNFSALVMLCAFGPVVLGSHVAWSHGYAPTLLAGSLAALAASAHGSRPRATAFSAGLLGALAVGAHPTVLVLLPGAVLWWLIAHETAMAHRLRLSLWVFAGLLVGYAPTLWFLATRGIAPFLDRLVEHDYVGGETTAWAAGVVQWLEGLARNLAGPPMAQPADPRLWLMVALIAAGLVASARLGQWLPLATVISGALLMPLLVDGTKFTSLTGLRYAAPALPAAAAGIGVWARSWWEAGSARRTAIVLIAVGAIAAQAWTLLAYYRFVERQGVTGRPVLEVVDGLIAGASTQDAIFIDDDIETKLTGGGEVGRAVADLLTLRGVAYTKAKKDKIRWFLANGDGASYDLVLSGNAADVLTSEFQLTAVRVVPVVEGQVSRTGAYWGWYRSGAR